MKRNRSMLFHPGLYVETLRQLRLMGSIYLVLCVVFTIVPALLDSLSGRLTQPGISDFSPPLFLFVYVAPVTLVYSAFGFLTRRNASDFYHSLPLTRECLYVSRVLAVLTYLVGTIVLSLLGACLVYALCGRPVNLSYVPDQFLYFTACAALVMGCALVGITATGTWFSAFIVTGIVLFLPRFISVLAGAMLESVAPIFYTWDLGPVFNYSLNLPASAVATLLSFGAIGDLSLEESMRYGAGILYTGVLGLGYTVLAGFFHHFRASETAGKSAPNRVLQHVYRCAISLPVFLVLGAALASEDWRLPFSDAAFFWPLFLLALAVYFIYELVTTRKARNLLPALCVLPVVVVVGFGLPVLGRAVGERMLRAVPAAEEVAYANLGMEPFGGMESYAELQISEVDAEDEELLSMLTGALDSTVAMYDGRTDSSYGSNYFPMGVRFHLRSGEEITRRVNFRDGDLARLAALLAAGRLPRGPDAPAGRGRDPRRRRSGLEPAGRPGVLRALPGGIRRAVLRGPALVAALAADVPLGPGARVGPAGQQPGLQPLRRGGRPELLHLLRDHGKDAADVPAGRAARQRGERRRSIPGRGGAAARRRCAGCAAGVRRLAAQRGAGRAALG